MESDDVKEEGLCCRQKGRQDEISYFIISSQRVVDFRGSDDLSVIAEPHPHLKNHYIHPSPSISSPSGTGHEDPL